MKRIIKLVLLVALIVIAVSSLNSFAAGSGIVTMSAEKVAPGEQYYLIINLSSINYQKFEVAITNSQSLVSSQTTGSVGNLASNGTVTTFTINKEAVGLDKLGIVYTAPQNEGVVNYSVNITPIPDIDVNSAQSRIDELNGTISDTETLLENARTQLSALAEDDPNRVEIESQISSLETQKDGLLSERDSLQSQLDAARNAEPITAGARIEVSQKAPEMDMKNMVSNKTSTGEMPKNENMLDADMMKDNEKFKDMENMQDKMKLMENNEKDMKDKMSSLQISLKDASDKITSLSQGTTYQGSNNNYLSNLSVAGYELNNTFDKTTNDYFINVLENVNSLNVTATKEDSSATVTIYGNTNLVSGQNKVIINVTAEDGSVRTYRVYVTK